MTSVFVAGDANVDIICGQARAAMGEETGSDIIIQAGGNAANFAMALGRLCMRPEFISSIGRDMFSGFIRKELKSAGVRAWLVPCNLPNGISVIMLDDNGERSISSDKGATAMLRAQDVRKRLDGRLGKGDILYIGGFFHMSRLRSGLAGLLRRARRSGATVLADLCFDKSGEWMKALAPVAGLMDVCFMDEAELFHLGKGAVPKLLSAGLSAVVLKKGRHGAEFHSNGMSISRPAIKTRCLDSTGAGDVFNAGYVLGMSRSIGPAGCLELGNFLAGSKVQRRGLFIPPKLDVEGFIRKMA